MTKYHKQSCKDFNHKQKTPSISFSNFQIVDSIFNVQFNPRNYENMLPATKTQHCGIFFPRNFPEFSEQFFQLEFEWLLLKLN